MDDSRLNTIEERLKQLDERVRKLETRSEAHWSRAGDGPSTQQERVALKLPLPPSPKRSLERDAQRRSVPVPDVQAADATAVRAPAEPLQRRAQARMPAWSFNDLEQLVSGRGLAWLGGLAILIGAVFFLGLAFTRGWIGPQGRVVIGLGAGVLLFAGGAWFFERREELFGHVLVATGLGTMSISLVAATRLYGLVPVPAGLIAAMLMAAIATVIAIRASSQVVAGYGLVTALAAPPLLGADATFTTIAFLATALIGTTAISLYRSWGWLPSVAFLLSAPQLVQWLLSDVSLPLGLGALAAYWLLNAVASGGEEFRTNRRRLTSTSATLLLANAAFLVFVGLVLLDGVPSGSGPFLTVTAIAHFLLGGYFLYDRGDRHPFGLLTVGTGVAALSMALPIQMGGPVVPIAWAAEAVALAWVYAQRKHIYSGGAAIVLGSLAVAHLMSVEYPGELIGVELESSRPFMNASGGVLGFILSALAVAGWLVPSRNVRMALATVGLLLVIYAVPFETSGLGLLASWSALFVAAIGLDRALTRLMGPPKKHPTQPGLELLVSSRWPAALAAVLALMHAVTFELSPTRLGALPVTPFIDQSTIGAGILIIASLLAGGISGQRLARRVSVISAAVLAAYLMPFELQLAAVVVAWSTLATALCFIGQWDRQGNPAYLRTVAILIGLAMLTVLAAVAPPDRLVVDSVSNINHPLFWSDATTSLIGIAIALSVAYKLNRSHQRARWVLGGAGAVVVYLLSVGVVDHFQGQVDTGATLGSLQKQGQVALSILWAVLGGAAFVTGVMRWRAGLRLGGLALLGLATTKVFLYDLASLDATYKVPSFIGLGILLLASSYVYQRLKPQVATRG